MAKSGELRAKSIDIIVLSAIGIIGLVTSVLLGLLVQENWIISIIVAMFSCTAFILAGIESIHKTIIRRSK